MTEEAIAAAFFVGVNVVKQRLRLAAAAPTLLEVYAEDGMTLEQLMAFTVSEDHARQEQVWEAIRDSWQKEPWQIRRMLTETTVRASDKRALFVGLDVYEAAGGIVLRDLFQSDDGGWLQDVSLLDRLVGEKLRTEADRIGTEGWKWVDARLSVPYGVSHGMREIVGTPLDMTEEEQATRAGLQAELDRLTDQYEDANELPDEIDQRLGEIEAALEALDNRPMHYDPAKIAIAGVFVTIDSDGSLIADRGYVRPEDEAPVAPDDDGNETGEAGLSEPSLAQAIRPVVVTMGGQPVPAEEEEDDGIKPLPERLVTELTAHRTLALRDAVAQNPRIAMTALLHKLVSDAFHHRAMSGVLEAQVRHTFFPAQAEDLGDSMSVKSVDERNEHWKSRIPADDTALWDWLTELDEENRLALLAHCVSYGVNALYERPNPYSGSGVSEYGLQLRFDQANRLARETGLDMVQVGWRPTVGNYLGRVTKTRILEAVREGAGERAAQLIDHMKKGDMAKEAERLLADSGWLPEPLRLTDPDGISGADLVAQDEGETALPAFLTDDGDDEEPEESEDEEIASIAAE